jgi:hypothetical protein
MLNRCKNLIDKYKEFSFVLNQTILTLTIFIEKREKYIEFQISLIGYIMKYIVTIYFFNVVDVSTLFYKFGQT